MADKNGFLPIGQEDFNLAAHFFMPRSLTLARELRGLTKADLAASIGKTPGAISQFENGKTKPDSKTMKALCLALGVDANFFQKDHRDSHIDIENCHFRSLRTASQRERRKVLASGSMLRELIDLVQEYVDFPAEQVSSNHRVVKNYSDIEECAIELRRAWGLGLGPIPDLIMLLESKGIIVTFIAKSCHEVDAFSVWHRGLPLIFLLNSKSSSSRCRFDAAHELGHLIMHHDVNPGDRELESQANRFAGAFLIPAESFAREFPRRFNLEHVYELKKRWGVSVAAIVKRAFDLGLISDATYRRAYMQLNQSGERYGEKHEPKEERPKMLSRSLSLIRDEVTTDDLARRLGLRLVELDDAVIDLAN